MKNINAGKHHGERLFYADGNWGKTQSTGETRRGKKNV
jgi:hypothetical protein